VPHTIPVIYPASGQVYFERLRHASLYDDQARILPVPVRLPDPDDGRPFLVAQVDGAALHARPLSHRCECFGYALIEPDGRRMLPEKLAERGVGGPAVGRLIREGSVRVGSRTVALEEVSVPRPGQKCAVVMDTRPCRGAEVLAANADLLVIEATFLSAEAAEAEAYAHLTAAQAARIGRDAGARRVALTHFSQRYTSPQPFHEEAARFHDDVFVAEDFACVPVPARRGT
jgi:ribonuclease Z